MSTALTAITAEAASKEVETIALHLRALPDDQKQFFVDHGLDLQSKDIAGPLYQFINQTAFESVRAELTGEPNEMSKWVKKEVPAALIITASKLYDQIYTESYIRRKKQKNLPIIFSTLLELVANHEMQPKDRIAAIKELNQMGNSTSPLPPAMGGINLQFVMGAPPSAARGNQFTVNNLEFLDGK